MNHPTVYPATAPGSRSSESPEFADQPAGAFERLDDLEAMIARRADEIAATLPARTPLNLYCWLQAEQEILAATKLLARERKYIHFQ
jgi:hypothetical protein